jgi:uncharacterized protein (DUF362 family)
MIGGFGEVQSPIIIKPNICAGTDVTGVANINVETVEALLKLLFDFNDDHSIRIVESDSESKYADEAFIEFGYKDLESRWQNLGYDVSLVNLSRSRLEEVELDGFYFKNPELPVELSNYGYYITVAVPKTHSLTLVTGTLKNQFGLLPRKNQSFYHPSINEVIIDLNRYIKPNLCIVDAVKGMEGVISGNPRDVNLVIAGKKPVSVDATMARIMGFDPNRIRHIVDSQKYELGTLNPEILGENLESSIVKFKTPSNLRSGALI